MSLTPHGPGFSFLDSFTVTSPGQAGRGRKHLDPTLSFFSDHFPGQPLMPGVLLIECAAQAAGALWASLHEADAPRHFILAQVVQFKLQRAVLPGETLESEVTVDNVFGNLAQFSATLFVNGQEVARGRIVLGKPV